MENSFGIIGIEPESQVEDLIIAEIENIVCRLRNSSISLLKLGIGGVSYWENVTDRKAMALYNSQVVIML